MEDLKKSVSEALENIQQRPWAEPLGKTLQFSGKIVKELRDFVPGAIIIGGALCFGAALLHPSPSMEDLQRQLGETQEKLDAKGNSEAVMRMLIQEKKDIRHKMENRDSMELKRDIDTVRKGVKDIFNQVVGSNDKFSGDISFLKDRIGQTFQLVADTRYKVSSERLKDPNISMFRKG